MGSLRILALLVTLNTGAWMIPEEAFAQQASVSSQVFYDDLSPYGMRVNYPNYGYVWIPTRGPGFTPYATAGHWEFTDDGWTWVSDYPWGWAPFHYGRWDYDFDLDSSKGVCTVSLRHAALLRVHRVW